MTAGASFFSRLMCLLALAVCSSLPAAAQEAAPHKTILVLDASGSMWGQLQGEAKITIAQRVVTDLLDRLPDSQQLGLMAYGHRRKGDCSDIELLVAPGADTRDEIAAAVARISPKGKTPLSAAVIQAAEQLKYEEEPATVILVSDGRETCDMDPCEVGTASRADRRRLHGPCHRLRRVRRRGPAPAAMSGRKYRRAFSHRLQCQRTVGGAGGGQRDAGAASRSRRRSTS